MSKILTSKDLNRVGVGRSNIDRKCEQEARPHSGSDNRASKGSCSGGAGSANGKGSEITNGMAVLVGQKTPQKSQAVERTETPKSKTPNKAVQDAKKKRVGWETGDYPRDGGWNK